MNKGKIVFRFCCGHHVYGSLYVDKLDCRSVSIIHKILWLGSWPSGEFLANKLFFKSKIKILCILTCILTCILVGERPISSC